METYGNKGSALVELLGDTEANKKTFQQERVEDEREFDSIYHQHLRKN